VQAGKGRLAVRRGNVTLSRRPIIGPWFDLRPALRRPFSVSPQETRLTFPAAARSRRPRPDRADSSIQFWRLREGGADLIKPDDQVGPRGGDRGRCRGLVASATTTGAARFGPACANNGWASAAEFSPGCNSRACWGPEFRSMVFDGSEFRRFYLAQLVFFHDASAGRVRALPHRPLRQPFGRRGAHSMPPPSCRGRGDTPGSTHRTTTCSWLRPRGRATVDPRTRPGRPLS